MNQQEETSNLGARLVKWEDLRRNQLAATNNLILTFCVASLGFIASNYFPCLTHWALRFGFISLIISIISGTALSLSRLYDYRYTADMIRMEKEEVNSNISKKTEINDLKAANKWLGKLTWKFLWVQLSFFLLAFFLIGIFFLW